MNKMAVTIKSQREIELMRESCKILADVFSQMEKAVHPGVSTLDINNLGEKLIRAHGCIPNFLNYNGYPASICVSVNDEVVHGIPHKDHILHEGDIVSLDAGLIYKGYHSDMARTFPVGQVCEEARLLMERTKEAFSQESRWRRQATTCMIFPMPSMLILNLWLWHRKRSGIPWYRHQPA